MQIDEPVVEFYCRFCFRFWDPNSQKKHSFTLHYRINDIMNLFHNAYCARSFDFCEWRFIRVASIEKSTWLNYHIVPLPLTINIEVLIIIIFDCTNPRYNAIQRTKLFTGNRRSRLTHTDPCWSNVQYYSSINIQSSLLKQRAAIDQEINPSFVEGVNGNSVGTIIQSVIWSELDSHYHQTRRKYGRETRECNVRGW